MEDACWKYTRAEDFDIFTVYEVFDRQCRDSDCLDVAQATLPLNLVLKSSTVIPTARGVFSVDAIPAHTRFGPLVGTPCHHALSHWKIFKKGGEVEGVSVADTRRSNWMRYVSYVEEGGGVPSNLVALQSGDNIFFYTVHRIPEDTELVVARYHEYHDRCKALEKKPHQLQHEVFSRPAMVQLPYGSRASPVPAEPVSARSAPEDAVIDYSLGKRRGEEREDRGEGERRNKRTKYLSPSNWPLDREGVASVRTSSRDRDGLERKSSSSRNHSESTRYKEESAGEERLGVERVEQEREEHVHEERSSSAKRSQSHHERKSSQERWRNKAERQRSASPQSFPSPPHLTPFLPPHPDFMASFLHKDASQLDPSLRSHPAFLPYPPTPTSSFQHFPHPSAQALYTPPTSSHVHPGYAAPGAPLPPGSVLPYFRHPTLPYPPHLLYPHLARDTPGMRQSSRLPYPRVSEHPVPASLLEVQAQESKTAKQHQTPSPKKKPNGLNELLFKKMAEKGENVNDSILQGNGFAFSVKKEDAKKDAEDSSRASSHAKDRRFASPPGQDDRHEASRGVSDEGLESRTKREPRDRSPARSSSQERRRHDRQEEGGLKERSYHSKKGVAGKHDPPDPLPLSSGQHLMDYGSFMLSRTAMLDVSRGGGAPSLPPGLPYPLPPSFPLPMGPALPGSLPPKHGETPDGGTAVSRASGTREGDLLPSSFPFSYAPYNGLFPRGAVAPFPPYMGGAPWLPFQQPLPGSQHGPFAFSRNGGQPLPVSQSEQVLNLSKTKSSGGGGSARGYRALPYPLEKKDGKINYECNVCHKTFGQLSNLKVHLRTHTGERPFGCNICGKKFTQLAHLQKHNLVHTGEKPHECPACHKRFSSTSNLKTHMRLHSGERPYKCDECDQKFTQLVHLKLHKRNHENERPYVCGQCDKAYISRSGLTTHCKTSGCDLDRAIVRGNPDERLSSQGSNFGGDSLSMTGLSDDSIGVSSPGFHHRSCPDLHQESLSRASHDSEVFLHVGDSGSSPERYLGNHPESQRYALHDRVNTESDDDCAASPVPGRMEELSPRLKSAAADEDHADSSQIVESDSELAVDEDSAHGEDCADKVKNCVTREESPGCHGDPAPETDAGSDVDADGDAHVIHNIKPRHCGGPRPGGSDSDDDTDCEEGKTIEKTRKQSSPEFHDSTSSLKARKFSKEPGRTASKEGAEEDVGKLHPGSPASERGATEEEVSDECVEEGRTSVERVVVSSLASRGLAAHREGSGGVNGVSSFRNLDLLRA